MSREPSSCVARAWDRKAPTGALLAFVVGLQGYAEGSHLAGTFVEDVTWVGSDDSDPSLERALGIPFLFGCHTAESGLFPTQVADGIMGLGPSGACAVSGVGGRGTPQARADSCEWVLRRADNTLIAQLEKQGLLDNYMFSMCLTPEGGIFNIGDYNASLHAAPLQSVRFSSSKFYQVAMRGVQLTGGSPHSPCVGTHAANHARGWLLSPCRPVRAPLIDADQLDVGTPPPFASGSHRAVLAPCTPSSTPAPPSPTSPTPCTAKSRAT